MTDSAQPVTFTRQQDVAVVRMQARHGNAVNEDLIGGLNHAFREAEADPAVKAILFTSGGKLFSPGLDLQELVDLDRPAMESFMQMFGNCLLALYTVPKPVVAALVGPAVAGGCVLALTADWRILKRDTPIGLNEVRVGVPLPYSVALLLRDVVHRPSLPEIALLGRNFRNEEAVAAGLVHQLRDPEGFEEHCLEKAAEFAARDAHALALTKRYLRSVALERMRVGDTPYRREFLDCWFSAATRERIDAVVAKLKQRGA